MDYVAELLERHPCLSACETEIRRAIDAIVAMHSAGGKLLLAGNGGSASDCEHIAGELLKGFLLKRELPAEALPELPVETVSRLQRGVGAIPLSSLSSVFTAFCNDVSPELAFAQLVFALGQPGDVFLGLSTSGNAKNVCRAAEVAKKRGLGTIAMTGQGGGALAEICEITIRAPETSTPLVQELHLPIYHAICAQVEELLFGSKD